MGKSKCFSRHEAIEVLTLTAVKQRINKESRMEQQYPLIGRKVVTMRWGDMDALGHLNNTYYFRYLEQIRLDWLESLGYTLDRCGEGPVLARTACTFRRELTYPGTLEITIELEKIGRSSVTFYHRFFRQEDTQTVYAYADVTLVWVNYQTGQPVPVPAAIRATLESHLAQS
jgi:acyl-CoA thioester hydrolase